MREGQDVVHARVAAGVGHARGGEVVGTVLDAHHEHLRHPAEAQVAAHDLKGLAVLMVVHDEGGDEAAEGRLHGDAPLRVLDLEVHADGPDGQLLEALLVAREGVEDLGHVAAKLRRALVWALGLLKLLEVAGQAVQIALDVLLAVLRLNRSLLGPRHVAVRRVELGLLRLRLRLERLDLGLQVGALGLKLSRLLSLAGRELLLVCLRLLALGGGLLLLP
mmetsp:Transcript_22487/g.66265  ORF Transcript_22487/g.66265 Transcript_22487/m.66265 type:complete len:220 (+) Transcript_22487:1612-2271(+)